MTPEQLIEVMRAARKLGATYVAVDGDGLEVDFDTVPARKARKRRAVVAQQEFPDVVSRKPELTEAQKEAIVDEYLNEYIP